MNFVCLNEKDGFSITNNWNKLKKISKMQSAITDIPCLDWCIIIICHQTFLTYLYNSNVCVYFLLREESVM